MIKHTYSVDGMTCEGCKASVEKNLLAIEGVSGVRVSLEKSEATITSEFPIAFTTLKEGLPSKYILSEKNIFKQPQTGVNEQTQKTKWEQLKPLFLILFFIVLITTASNYPELTGRDLMLDFMGLFLMIFSLFKWFDLKGFATSFSMYDPLAGVWKPYAYIYPAIETILGILLLMRIETPLVLLITLVVLTITTIGVTKALVSKNSIQCACLGTVLDLPMTEATFIENAIMITMAIVMILGWI